VRNLYTPRTEERVKTSLISDQLVWITPIHEESGYPKELTEKFTYPQHQTHVCIQPQLMRNLDTSRTEERLQVSSASDMVVYTIAVHEKSEYAKS